jgi:hypothetical protein
MPAHDLAEPYPTVLVDADAQEAFPAWCVDTCRR